VRHDPGKVVIPILHAHQFVHFRRVTLRKLWMASLCFVAAIATANAQSNYAVVRGSVFDPQHRAIPGAHIHANEVSTGAEREVVSNASGLYEIAGLQPGAYTLTVDGQGFSETKQSINLEVGQQATLDIELRVTQDVQTVKVAASGELLKTQDASVGEVVDQHSVDSLPLNGRMLIDLVLTVPGAHVSHGAGTGDMNPLYWRPGQRSAPLEITSCWMGQPTQIPHSAPRT
jgi:hypothetical protein